AAYPHAQCIHQLFEEQAERTPDKVALVCEERSLTYRELNERANQLAHYLCEQGVVADTLVGLYVERSIEMVVGVLAILKAGGAYVPLDTSYPKDRLAYMLEDCGATILLTQDGLHQQASDMVAGRSIGIASLDCKELNDALPGRSRQNPHDCHAGPRNLAYVIYTSGSTGHPKGVLVEHQALVNRIDWMQREYPLGETDVVLQKTPFGFDVSVWELTWPFIAGARLVMAKPEGHKDTAYLASVIQSEGVTTLHFVPSMLRLMASDEGWQHCTSVRQVFCSGEALPVDVVASHYAANAAPLHNLYGPTEAAIDVSYWACPKAVDLVMVPIGRPIQNMALYVLGAQNQLLPKGSIGELHIGGIGLARGYLKRSELTAGRFIPNPFHDPLDPSSSARLYKTGDLARHLADGNIEYIGRIDDQVKIRGLRIELGEIESQLAACAGVLEAVAAVREDRPGHQRLVAYVVPDDSTALSIPALQAALVRVLPEYMVPSAWQVLDALPLTPNGKLDRKALPAPDGSHLLDEYLAPRTATEETLVGIWASLLQLNSGDISVNANFFALGGNSLLLVQLFRVIKSSFDVEIGVRGAFTNVTIGLIAKSVDALQGKSKLAQELSAVPANQIEEMEF
ncbi:amino acid adenylation domain-containing protein, partial [Janthinobacterium sp. BJB401]|uniref:non-ribosomal peptide synthetase n=1 Tax=Janthinobacterium sp. BJB401 TaxID=2745934 RepID=UPI001595E461